MNPYEKFSDNTEASNRRRESALEDLRSMVERIIDDAQAKGAFENLPGRGKPLNLDPHNPYAQDRETAYKLLKDNDYTLPWIADRNAMLAKIAAFRRNLSHTWQETNYNYQIAPSNTHRVAIRLDWSRRCTELDTQLAKLNGEINTLNLSIPVPALEIIKLNLDTELARLNTGRELP